MGYRAASGNIKRFRMRLNTAATGHSSRKLHLPKRIIPKAKKGKFFGVI